jgi:hypothetical protein
MSGPNRVMQAVEIHGPTAVDEEHLVCVSNLACWSTLAHYSHAPKHSQFVAEQIKEQHAPASAVCHGLEQSRWGLSIARRLQRRGTPRQAVAIRSEPLATTMRTPHRSQQPGGAALLTGEAMRPAGCSPRPQLRAHALGKSILTMPRVRTIWLCR